MGINGIPAGFVLVQANYLEQISKVAEGAVISARDNVDTLKTIVVWGGSVFALIGSILAFFGFNSFRKIRGVGAKLETIKNQEAQLASRMESIDRTEAELKQKISNMDETLKRMGMFAVEMGTAAFKNSQISAIQDPAEKKLAAQDLIPVVESVLNSAKELEQERAISWANAVLGVLHSLAGDLKKAYEFAKTSAAENPKNWEDRNYNIACICSLLFAEDKQDHWKAEALQCFEKSLSETVVELAIKDQDLEHIRAEVNALIEKWKAQRNGSA